MVLDWVKFLRKLEKKQQNILYNSISQIIDWNIKWLDIKAISGKKWYFRCREWNIRIIYLVWNGKIIIKKVWNRGDIYKWLKNI